MQPEYDSNIIFRIQFKNLPTKSGFYLRISLVMDH